MAKRSFILFHDYKEQFLCLSDEECGQLIKAIFIYETEGEQTALPEQASMAFRFIRHALDENRGKYEDICKKRSEAAKKSHSNRTSANAGNCKQMQAIAADTDTGTDTGTGTGTDTGTDTVTETETETVQQISAEKTEENITPTHQKKARGDFLNVYLSTEEMLHLISDYGLQTATDAVNLLSTRIARDPNSKYKDENHYATIKSWVITAVKEQQMRQKELEEKSNKQQNKPPVRANDSFDFDFEDIYERP